MSRTLARAAATPLLYLVGSTASCGLTSDPLANEIKTVGQALEVADFVIGTDTPIREQYDTGNYPNVAANGEQRFVVFEDGGRIRGVRFDARGHVVDQEWVDLGVDERVQTYPAVAFGNDRYMVVWSELEEAGASIYGQAVTPQGQAQGERTLLTQGFDAQVCWFKDSFVMVWSDNGINLARLDVDGSIVGDGAVKVTTDAVTNVTRPSIAASDEMGVVAFSEDDGTRRNLRVARFDNQGQVLDPNGIVVNPTILGTSEYALTASDNQSLITFKDEAGRLRGSLLSVDGALASTEFEVTTDTEIGGHTVGNDGSGFVVVWDCPAGDVRQLCASAIAEDGAVSESKVTLGGASSAGQVMNIDMTFGDGGYAVVYEGVGVVGQQFPVDLDTKSVPLQLSTLPNAQNIPYTAWNGAHYVLSWVDERNDGFQTRAVRITEKGEVLDPDGILVSTADRQSFTAAAASNRSGTTAFVFTTTEESSAFVRTMNTDGSLSDTVLLADGNPQGVDIVGNGSTFLVGYQVGSAPTSPLTTVYVLPLDEAGSPQGNPVPIVPDYSRPRVSMVAQGQDFLITYSGQTQDTGAPVNGKVVRVSATGQKLAELDPPAAGNPYYTIASNPDGAVVFGWNDSETGELWFRILNGDSWADTALLTAASSQEAPAFVWDGKQFTSVWVESRTALWTRAMSANGTLGEETIVVDGDHGWPRLVMGPGPEMLLTSVHWELFSRTRRIESRFAGPDGITLPVRPAEGDATESMTIATRESESNDTAADSNVNSPTSPQTDPRSSTSSSATTTPITNDTSPDAMNPDQTSTRSPQDKGENDGVPNEASDNGARQTDAGVTDTNARSTRDSSRGCALVPARASSKRSWLTLAVVALVACRIAPSARRKRRRREHR
jgi:hypothetical protein